MRKSLTRTLAGVVFAAATVLALAGPANAAPVHPRVHTTLSIVQSRNVIKAGEKDVIAGRLVADHYGLAHKFVYLDRWFGGRLPAPGQPDVGSSLTRWGPRRTTSTTY